MIDPLQSLSFSMQSNPGVYAVLLGSGVSQAAKIPTGWDITLELVRKLALLQRDDAGANPEDWFRTKFGRDPNYSELLETLAPTPSARQQLLYPYFEPTESEREEGLKTPTLAHRSIATLVAKGFIRVIVTSNFDRLMELALANEGVTPTVISSVDLIQGSMPLMHTRCCVIKLHGDYSDTRILNTPSELSKYPKKLNSLLDRVLDDFGLVVCGWSGEWDDALRAAIQRSPSRRFTMYWASRQKPKGRAGELIAHRNAVQIEIDSADHFFSSLAENIEALNAYAKPHPVSKAIAIASLKRYLSEARYRIQLNDLLIDEAERAIATLTLYKFSMNPKESEKPDADNFTRRIEGYEIAHDTLTALASEAGYWGGSDSIEYWVRVASIVCRPQDEGSGGNYHAWQGLAKYPTVLLIHALGLGAVESGNIGLLGKILTETVEKSNQSTSAIAMTAPIGAMFEVDEHGAKAHLKGRQGHVFAMNNHLHDRLRENFRRIVPSDLKYTRAFDRLELLLSLSYAYHRGANSDWYWAPRGPWIHRHESTVAFMKEIDESLKLGEVSPYVTARIFGTSARDCKLGLDAFMKHMGMAVLG